MNANQARKISKRYIDSIDVSYFLGLIKKEASKGKTCLRVEYTDSDKDRIMKKLETMGYEAYASIRGRSSEYMWVRW